MAHKQINGRIADILIYLWEQVYHDRSFEFVCYRERNCPEFAACLA